MAPEKGQGRRMRHSLVSLLVVFAMASALVVGCSQAAAPAAAPTKASEPAKAAQAAQPTAAPAASAATYPEKGKPITMQVFWDAGGSTDVGARLLAASMEKVLGTTITVVNKPGAGGQLGYTGLSQTKPDGYTFGTTNFPSAVISYLDPSRKATYTRKSFDQIGLMVIDPGMIAVRPDSPYKTLKDLVDAAKANPKKIRVSTTGLQSDEHFAMAQFQRLAGIQLALVHFPDGTAKAKAAWLGGNIDVLVSSAGDGATILKNGEGRILGVMDEAENPFLPGVPTFTSQGYKLVFGSSRGFSLPAGAPKQVVDTLSNAMGKAVEDPDLKQKMLAQGLSLRYKNAQDYSKYWDDYETMLKDLIPLTKE